MLSDKETTHISKFLSLVLRHKPETIGITLNENGWTSVALLLEKMNHEGKVIDLDILKFIVETNTKKRFAFNEDFSQIRASQGHSLNIELGYEPKQPPALLFHGTAVQNVAAILEHGLIKGKRHHVHLSTSTDTAKNVGSRYGKPVLLDIQAGQMHKDGYKFFISENNVWLTDNVPAHYITVIED
ncbi:RNA 2'-phosphotransferase [Flavobacterium sp. AG291]|uniref:RNA 2'-phosphotransferase n=1 Tax=Flavobacterium sp. AG291 TaxID=2184000 RepID=UPI000E0A3D0D|nr:RNA 2'-phosphotransferase [Flavobacterium sp. AG291]RDI07007.1 putative RNA 2'-phosphotransferase [Flavobacterium sp. AG291]